MKILTASQIREADAFTISDEPVASTDLMERAANACFDWIAKHFEKNKSFKVFCGIGNNGGDGLVIGRKLLENGYPVEVFIVRFSDNCSTDFQINYDRLKKLNIKITEISTFHRNDFKNFSDFNNSIIIDAIFGSGLSRPVSGIAADVIHAINRSKLTVVSIDVPSGLFCEDNSTNIRENIVKATHTLTFELPKLAFMFPENAANAGNWQVIPIGLSQKFIEKIDGKFFFITQKTAKTILKERRKFSHKGTFGHALLITGSYGKMGASVLSARACQRSGAGLTTVHIPKCGYEILQISSPETMVSPDSSQEYISELPKLEKYNVVGIGPGIGTEKQTQNVLKLLFQNYLKPIVIDADAINIIAENKTWLSFIPKHSIFTPHPKEFERLAGKSGNDFERMQMQIEFSKKYNVYVVLKTAHTCITCPDGEVFFNSTGNPGMATGGSGDVLTGILTGLPAQQYSPKEASVLGVYLHGLAGDIAAVNRSAEAMIASDIIENMGEAFGAVR